MGIGTSMFRKSCVMLPILCASIAARGQQANSYLAFIESLIRSQQYDKALQAAKSTLTENPKDFRLWTLEAIVFSIQKNNSEALDAFGKALSLSPNYVPALKGEVQLLYPAKDQRAVPLLER